MYYFNELNLQNMLFIDSNYINMFKFKKYISITYY